MDPRAPGWLVAAASAGALLAVVFLGWLPDRARSVRQELSPGLAPPSVADIATLADTIAQLDQRLARFERALASLVPHSEREPLRPEPASDGQLVPLGSGPDGLDELHRDLQQLSKRVDLLASGIKEKYKPAYLLPTLEQVHAARRDVDWAFLEPLRQLCANDRDAASARVRFMTFDEVLRKIGLPNSIDVDDGRWNYVKGRIDENGQPARQGIAFRFVGDTVSGVNLFP